MATRCSQPTPNCCEPGRHFKFELIIAARHRLSWPFFLKNTDPRNCRDMNYMQESRMTAAYHVNAIAAQQVALQYIARQSRCLSPPVWTYLKTVCASLQYLHWYHVCRKNECLQWMMSQCIIVLVFIPGAIIIQYWVVHNSILTSYHGVEFMRNRCKLHIYRKYVCCKWYHKLWASILIFMPCSDIWYQDWF